MLRPRDWRHQPKNWFCALVSPFTLLTHLSVQHNLVCSTKIQIVMCIPWQWELWSWAPLSMAIEARKALVPRTWVLKALDIGPRWVFRTARGCKGCRHDADAQPSGSHPASAMPHVGCEKFGVPCVQGNRRCQEGACCTGLSHSHGTLRGGCKGGGRCEKCLHADGCSVAVARSLMEFPVLSNGRPRIPRIVFRACGWTADGRSHAPCV